MGLFLRYNLFYRVSPEAVYDAYIRFYQERGQSLVHDGHSPAKAYELHHRDGDWTVLQWDSGWEWVVRRQAQFHVSRELNCPGLLVFVYDGDYWAYEFFKDGVALDCFVQQPDETHRWFPGQSCAGNSGILVESLPFLNRDILDRYLAQQPSPRAFQDADNPRAAWLAQLRAWDVKPQPSDEFTRFNESAVWDFLRYLGVGVERGKYFLKLRSPVWTRFWLDPK